MSSVPGAFAENLRRYAPATRRLREAAQRYVDAAVPGAVATVAALPCREPGCPPVEVAVQVLAAARPAAFAVRRAPDEVTEAELLAALAAALAAQEPQPLLDCGVASAGGGACRGGWLDFEANQGRRPLNE